MSLSTIVVALNAQLLGRIDLNPEHLTPGQPTASNTKSHGNRLEPLNRTERRRPSLGTEAPHGHCADSCGDHRHRDRSAGHVSYLAAPSGKGHLSRLVLSGIWSLSKAIGHRLGSAVGPAAMTAVVVLWVVLQGAGWALVYYPHLPGGFTYSPGINPAPYSPAAEALYVSFVTLGTLGFGDAVATNPWIRLASPWKP